VVSHRQSADLRAGEDQEWNSCSDKEKGELTYPDGILCVEVLSEEYITGFQSEVRPKIAHLNTHAAEASTFLESASEL
jgi:hypothetical protein